MTTMTDDLRLPEAPSIPGLRFRRFRDVADYGPMAEIAKAASLHDDTDYIPDPESMRVDYENTTDLVPTRDIVIAEVDGAPVAWANVMRQLRDDLAVYTSLGTVHPEWRRRGIGRTLLRANEAHNRALASSFEDPGGRAFGSWAGDREGGAPELMAAEGYVPVRYYFTMILRSLEAIPDAPLPDGLDIRAVRDEDRRAIFDADNEAFRDHWGHRETTEEDFAGLFALPDLDTSLWSVAWAGDEVAGSVQTFVWKAENEALGVGRGWLEHISVRRPWRRRGVARAIIADALRRLRAIGIEEAMLGVDSENSTGALGLYEALGFEQKDRSASYRKAWTAGGPLVGRE